MERIDPQPASGFRDYLPADAAARQSMMDRIARVFERFGFSSIDTPSLERLDVLTGGDAEFKKQLYQARITEDDEPLGLRFDLTIPLARYVAAHADDLVFPFSRYHIGKLWRGEHTQAGRYREFVQCDADIIGAHSVVADAQIIALAFATFRELGLANGVTLRLSNRRALSGLPAFLDFSPDRLPGILRSIDKLAKQGWETVATELKEKSGLDGQQIDAIQELLELRADDPLRLLDAADEYLKFSPESHAGIEELRELVSHLDAFGVPRSAWAIDLSIMRGLGYYTGTVFETTLNALPQFGSVCSGGRYDNLVERFAPIQLSGVGCSIGMDRLFAALDELGLVEKASAVARVGLLSFDADSRPAILKLATDLRDAGISTTLYVGSDTTLKGQLAWAVKSGFPLVVIMGAQEQSRSVVQLKDMAARTQEEIPLAELARRLS